MPRFQYRLRTALLVMGAIFAAFAIWGLAMIVNVALAGPQGFYGIAGWGRMLIQVPLLAVNILAFLIVVRAFGRSK